MNEVRISIKPYKGRIYGGRMYAQENDHVKRIYADTDIEIDISSLSFTIYTKIKLH